MNTTNKHRVDVDAVRRQAEGRWDQILPSLAPDLKDAFDKFGKHVKCPVHGGQTEKNFRALNKPGFARDGAMACNTCGTFSDGFAVLQWVNGLSFIEAVHDVDDWLNGSVRSLSAEEQAKLDAERARKAEAERKETAAKDARYKRNLNKVWEESVPLSDPSALPGRKYLAKRGLHLTRYPVELRFHPAVVYKDENGKYRGKFPALIARLRLPDGTPSTLLRMYTNNNGDKLPWDDRKKMMSHPSTTSLAGSAIRLGPLSPIIGVAEGVETALAATEIDGVVCWSCYSATLLEQFVPPPGVQKVIIYADKDMSERGIEAARKLAECLKEMGITGAIRLPKGEIPEGEKGIDWLDVLRASKAARRALAKAA